MATKACFITGAASGIGLATAKRFAAEGYFVGLSDVDEDALAKAAAEFDPDTAVAIRLDVRNEAAWGLALARFGKASGGRLDVMVNNAGLARYGWFETQTSADWDLQIDVNLRGVIYGSYAALPLLKATKGSVLVNIASSAGLSGPPRLAVYGATKFAVRGLSKPWTWNMRSTASGWSASCRAISTPPAGFHRQRRGPGVPVGHRGGSVGPGLGGGRHQGDLGVDLQPPPAPRVGAHAQSQTQGLRPAVEAMRAYWKGVFAKT
uniref:SDR family NAD(P)-dependent oxidoreductase n=1 Tax=Phenylobacterium glaciei TaxID=2803784 RepID=A0A974P4X8_9CAUL|nr:SDR family NAD(P)-dependent oxidoreductase [Phenylobacterium glaciei]